MPTLLTIILDAFRAASQREVMPTTLGTAELRDLGEDVLARSVFTAHGCHAVFVSKIKEVVDLLVAGDIDEATARVTLLETLKTLAYTPEGGFTDAPAGQVPPAIKGTLQDLSSLRRLKLIVETQRALMTGAGQQARGSEPARLKLYPAWELIREISVKVPRNWGGAYIGIPKRGTDPRSRWTIAGGTLTADRMIALKGDPIWGELGGYGNFPDALGVDHPPFAFNSGMGWQEISRDEVAKLGITGPNGETPTEYHGGPVRPRTLAGPVPQISSRTMDPEIRKSFEQKADAVTVEGTTVPRSRADEIRARMATRLEKSIADRKAEYAAGGD